MDLSTIISTLQESLYLIVVFAVFFVFAIKKGRQTVTNIIFGLYLALLISIEFPFYDTLLSSTSSESSEAMLRLIIFGFFTVLSTMLFARVLPREYSEGSFEGFGSKLLLAFAGTVLVMIYSFHVLPVTELITPGSPINYLFGSAQYFFYWLLVPLAILFVV